MSLLNRILTHAATRPQSPAVVENGQVVLTYAALVHGAMEIGAGLRGRGAGPETVVGLHRPKSADYVLGLLGIWWAGAAFLPLDPDLPHDRLVFMARDAGVHSFLGPALWHDPLRPPPSIHKDRLAYIIYTSGSSGTPKGVMVTWSGLDNLWQAQADAFGLDSSGRSLWLLSTSFDASVSDIGTALWAGSALYIEPHCPHTVLETIRRRSITYVDIPPALLAVLDADQVPDCLRTIVIGGEVCPPAAVRRFARKCAVFNVYGPTEATVCASMVKCDADSWQRPMLGTPLPGVTMSLRDASLAVVPPGTEGEICLGGAGLAREYCNQPELTASAFVECQGERLYRTGDLGLAGADGCIEFIGRIDRQVKVRGMLVRPEEVEHRLLQHAHVRRAVVVKEAALTAYVVAAPPVSSGELRHHLATFLPGWMIPARWHFVDALPEGSSGKVRVPPRSLREAALAGLWKDVLALPDVDLAADFFDLGGDSLAVIAVLAAADRQGIPLSAEEIYQGRTVEAIAAGPGAVDARPGSWLRADGAMQAMPRRVPHSGPPRHILMTGATGFLGARLLQELLNRTAATVHCLVRRPASPSSPRIRYWLGDLEQPHLGLTPEAWSHLSATVDSIYHCGAQIHMLKPYEALRAANVGGTQEIVRLVGAGQPKRLHYASTLSVFEGTGLRMEGAATETVHGGYAQTKWACEALLRDCGVPVSIYRFGLLTGAAHDWLSRFIRDIAAMGAVPVDGTGLAVDLTPVEYAAAAMAHLSLTETASTTYHIANSRPATLQMWVEALRAADCPIREVQASAWLEAAPPAAAAALCRLSRPHGSMDLFAATDTRFDMTNTHRGLEGSDIVCPVPTPEVLTQYVRRMLDGA